MINTEIVDYIKKSFELKSQGFYKPAIEMLYKALCIDGDNIEILAQLAQLYELLENYERALYYIEKVLELDTNHLESLNLLVEIYIEQGDFLTAKQTCEKICKLQPSGSSFVQAIKVLNKLNDFDAIKELEKNCTQLNDEVLYEIACAYYKNDNLQKAIELLEAGYSKNTQSVNIMELLGKIYYDSADFDKSKKIFKSLIDVSPTPEALNYLGLFALEEQKLTDAIEYFSKAKKLDEKNAQYSYNLASAYFLNGWFDEALLNFNSAICFEPDNVNYHYSLAYLYYQKGLYPKALSELKLIKKLEPEHMLSNVLNAMIIAKQGDSLSAKNLLESITKENKTDDFAFYALSSVYKELLQFDLAKRTIKLAIFLNPKSLNYLSELADIEIEQKNYEEALGVVKKVLEINDKYLWAYISLAKINLELGNYDEVYEAAQNLIELDSNCAQGYYYNAIALFEQGDKDFAIESLKKSISLDLNNAILYVKMSEFYQELGDLKNAYDWAKEASEIDERNYKYKWLCAKLASSLKREDDALKNYSQSYRLASFDKDLKNDYANYLKSVGKEKQAEKLLK